MLHLAEADFQQVLHVHEPMFIVMYVYVFISRHWELPDKLSDIVFCSLCFPDNTSNRKHSDGGGPFIDFGEEAEEQDLEEIKRRQDAEFDFTGKTIPTAKKAAKDNKESKEAGGEWNLGVPIIIIFYLEILVEKKIISVLRKIWDLAMKIFFFDTGYYSW